MRAFASFILVASILCFGMVMPAAAQHAKTKLTSEELKQLLPGKTMSTKNDRGQSFSQIFNADGSTSGQSTKSASDASLIKDSGTWGINGNNQVCVIWDTWRPGCFDFLRAEDGSYWYVNRTGFSASVSLQ